MDITLPKTKSRKLQKAFKPTVLRRISQIGFLTFIIVIATIHFLAGETSSNLTASAEAFCPFGGLESLYTFIASGGQTVPHTHLSNLVVLGALLITALLLRNAFCGWVCPLGFLQDLIYNLRRTLEKRFPSLRRGLRSIQRRVPAKLAAGLDHWLRFVKYGVLAWAVIGAGIYGVMVFRDYDPWATLLNVAELTFTPGLIVLGITLIASFFVERPWCRYACPLGAASGLVGALSPVYLKRDRKSVV